MSTDNPTMDELNSLPHLDHVVREVLRSVLIANAIWVSRSEWVSRHE